jgi:hypothetical protein
MRKVLKRIRRIRGKNFFIHGERYSWRIRRILKSVYVSGNKNKNFKIS